MEDPVPPSGGGEGTTPNLKSKEGNSKNPAWSPRQYKCENTQPAITLVLKGRAKNKNE